MVTGYFIVADTVRQAALPLGQRGHSLFTAEARGGEGGGGHTPRREETTVYRHLDSLQRFGYARGGRLFCELAAVFFPCRPAFAFMRSAVVLMRYSVTSGAFA